MHLSMAGANRCVVANGWLLTRGLGLNIKVIRRWYIEMEPQCHDSFSMVLRSEALTVILKDKFTMQIIKLHQNVTIRKLQKVKGNS